MRLYLSKLAAEGHNGWHGASGSLSSAARTARSIRSALLRATAVEGWSSAAVAGQLLLPDRELRLDQLFHPRTFLDALRQQSAR